MSDEPAVKPGKKTSEHTMTYIMTAIAVAVGTVLSLELPEESPWVKVAGFLAPIIAGLGYTVCRTKAKQAAKILVFAIVLPVLLVGCTCALEKQTLEELDDTQDLIFPEYIRLVEKEYAGDADKIENEKLLVETAKEALDELKKDAEE
jgi:hypothetical protein